MQAIVVLVWTEAVTAKLVFVDQCVHQRGNGIQSMCERPLSVLQVESNWKVDATVPIR